MFQKFSLNEIFQHRLMTRGGLYVAYVLSLLLQANWLISQALDYGTSSCYGDFANTNTTGRFTPCAEPDKPSTPPGAGEKSSCFFAAR